MAAAIVSRHAAKWSAVAIARELGVSTRTVYNYVAAHRCACGNFVSQAGRMCNICNSDLLRVEAWNEADLGFETPCWVWQGRDPHGRRYATIRINGRLTYAHRHIYEKHEGPIPHGLTLDHLCEIKPCVRPSHLQPVTLGENSRRRWERQRLRAA